MATDVDVQYFSHLNGLTLGNNWGDLIRLLDKALVTGIDFTQITAASIDAQGDVHITLYAAHNAMLFQVVELTGFAPSSLNQKYRIKGVPNTTQLILKPALDIVERSIITVGTGKLASLGYEIIFRDPEDVKRVYRAKNPTAQHPFIRVDESLASLDGTSGAYASTYAKFAMVGLLEKMNHIDDFNNGGLELPFDPAMPTKNWDISGTGASVYRGWSKWYWAGGSSPGSAWAETTLIATGPRNFTLVGDVDAFYLTRSMMPNTSAGTGAKKQNVLCGAGLYDTSIENLDIPEWFLMTSMDYGLASNSKRMDQTANYEGGGTPLGGNTNRFHVLNIDQIGGKAIATPILPNTSTGMNDTYKNHLAGIEIPFYDNSTYLRGVLKHAYYLGNRRVVEVATPDVNGTSMYVIDSIYTGGEGSLLFYLGEIE